MNERSTAARGFTLIEVLVTTAIVAVLASIVLPLAEMAVQRGKEQDLRRALREIRNALDAYRQACDEGRIVRSPEQSGFPPTLQALVDGVPDAKSARRAKIYFLRKLPRDPFHSDPNTPPEQTWGLRSYESSSQEPHAGSDVFDVYSMSPRVGLNGTALRSW